MKSQRWVVLGALCVLLSACTHTVSNTAAQTPINWTPEKAKRVVIVEPDVVLSELTAGGVAEARADWTQTGKEFIQTDIAAFLASKNIDAVPSGDIIDPREIQLVKLHGAVGVAILQNTLLNLPTKGKTLDWTLGPGTAALRDHYGCDYALFVFMRDSYSSAGRTAMIIGAALLGVGIQGGQQIGFASLVDLRSGQIVWFNRLASTNGSLKEAKAANDTVANLLNGLPL
jgi:hypothetical protein